MKLQLRDHPLITSGFGGFSSWPPYWVNITTPGGDKPRGEIGTLEKVTMRNDVEKVLFLWVDYNGSRYVGGMFIGDRAFCRETFRILNSHIGVSIKEIGDLDLSLATRPSAGSPNADS